MSHWCCACHCNVPFPAPAAQSHAPTLPGCFNRLRLPPNVTLVLRHSVTLQRTLPCTSHPEPRSNATRMLQSPATKCHTGFAPATQRHTATYMQRTIPCTSHPEPRSNATRMLQSTAPATKCHTGAAPATQRHTATYPSLHQPPRATLQRYQDASITCHQMSHWCCACHATSRCNAHATYSLHQPPRPTLQRYQDASIDCACHQMSHWCCATASHCNAPFPAPATQSHAPTLPGCFNHLPPNVTLVLRLPHNVTLQRTCNVPFPAPATQSHAPTLPGCFNRLRLPPNVTLVLRLPHNVTLQRTLPCTSRPEPRSNATRMLQSPATKCRTGAAPATQRHAATHMQRTIPCTSHPEPRSNATRMLQSTAPATKCHTGAAPATQRHTATYPSLHQPPRATLQRYQDASITCHQMSHWCCACHATSRCNAHATYHSLHQPPRATLQRYQDASIDCACHQMSHWCCACHTTSHCNVPFPAPAAQSHAPTLPGCFNHLPPNVTLVLRLPHNVTIQRTKEVSRVQASQFHVYKRANFTCTSEPAPKPVGWFSPLPLVGSPPGFLHAVFWGHGRFSAGQTHAEELKTLKDSHSGMLNAQSAKDQFLGGFFSWLKVWWMFLEGFGVANGTILKDFGGFDARLITANIVECS